MTNIFNFLFKKLFVFILDLCVSDCIFTYTGMIVPTEAKIGLYGLWR